MVRIDLAGEPSPELCKEVYAHYGLCMAIAQGFETHLVNMVTLYATTNSPEPVRSTYLRFEAEFQKLTFGNLVKALSKYDYLDSLESEVSQMKQTRDFLAHRFFRERSSDFVSVGGCEQLIQELNAIRIAFDHLEDKVMGIETDLTRKIRFHSPEFRERVERSVGETITEAREKFRTQ